MIIRKFWQWYERNYTVNLGLAAGLFLLQIIHLVWLFSEVIWAKLFGASLFTLHGMPKVLMVLVDYTEIPAILGISLVYINEMRKKWSLKTAMYFALINLQWLHLFWITDEFVVDAFIKGATITLPAWLAWAAILIDSLEVPVVYDTVKRFFASVGQKTSWRYSPNSKKISL